MNGQLYWRFYSYSWLFFKHTHIYAAFKMAVLFWSVSQKFVKSQHQNHYCYFLWTSHQFLLTKHCVTNIYHDTGFCCGLHCAGDSRTTEEMEGSNRSWRNSMTDGLKHTEYSLGRHNILHARSLRLEISRYLFLFVLHTTPLQGWDAGTFNFPSLRKSEMVKDRG